jgi:hypothetical protein
MEQALAREALRLSLAQHRELAVSLKGVQQQRSIADTFRQTRTGQSLVDMMKLDLLIASGGVLSHAPRRSQAVAMMMDSFQPEGVTRIAVDSVFMMPHLGVLSELEPDIALEVLKKDCLIPLGTILAPRGAPRKGWALQVALDGKAPVEVTGGRIVVIPCPRGVSVQAEIIPRKPLDMGGGPGKTVHATLEGGLVGIVVDARGRPLPLSPSADHVLDWIKAMSLCEETCLHTLQASSSPRA